MKNVCAVKAIEDHVVTNQPQLLSFIAGETFAVLAKPSKTWWKGVRFFFRLRLHNLFQFVTTNFTFLLCLCVAT